eukprot:scaffold322570_cov35-Tisochrysis_lutea.AAC.2
MLHSLKHSALQLLGVISSAAKAGWPTQTAGSEAPRQRTLRRERFIHDRPGASASAPTSAASSASAEPRALAIRTRHSAEISVMLSLLSACV